MNKNDYYNGNVLLPKAGTKRSLTLEQAQEFMKCANDPEYFADNYFYAVHQKHGLTKINLYDYQKDALRQYQDKGRLVMLTARQVGKNEHYLNPTPLAKGGFKLMKDISVGDQIIGSNGKPTNVTYKTEKMFTKMYRVTFDDKTYLDVGEDHYCLVMALSI